MGNDAHSRCSPANLYSGRSFSVVLQDSVIVYRNHVRLQSPCLHLVSFSFFYTRKTPGLLQGSCSVQINDARRRRNKMILKERARGVGTLQYNENVDDGTLIERKKTIMDDLGRM